MPQQHRPIFRAGAVRRYVDRQRKITFPRLVRRRIFAYLWIALAGLLVAAGVITWYAERSMSAERSPAGVAVLHSCLKSPASRTGEHR